MNYLVCGIYLVKKYLQIVKEELLGGFQINNKQ